MDRILTAVACLALACAGSATAQTSTGTSPNATDHAASSSSHATKRHSTKSAKSAKAHQAGGANETPSGGLMNPKDVAPGTYNASGGAVPRTSDPAQTRNTREGQPLSGSTAASGTGK